MFEKDNRLNDNNFSIPNYSPIHSKRIHKPNNRHVHIILPIHNSLQIIDHLHNRVIVLNLPERYEHAKDGVARQNGGIVQSSPHGVQNIREFFATVYLTGFPKVRQEFLLEMCSEKIVYFC